MQWISRPSPAIVIAVIALVAAIAGTAVAGPQALTRAISRGKVKKIAAKQANKAIDQRESGLSVEHAQAADTATTADNVSNQLWAIVNADGSLHRATTGIVNSARDDAGKYLVTADRSLTDCFAQATLGGNTPDQGLRGDISVNPLGGDPNGLYVLTSSEAAAQNADRPFTLLIRC